jgi:Rrf2 family protein
MLSKKAKYALKALVSLARKRAGGPVLIADLAEGENIPKKFLEAILLDLRRFGLLDSRKGKGGGYWLVADPEKVAIGPLVRHFDGPLAAVPCVSETAYRPCDDCANEASCAVRLVMKEVRDAAARILDSMTLAEMIRRSDQAARPKKGRSLPG